MSGGDWELLQKHILDLNTSINSSQSFPLKSKTGYELIRNALTLHFTTYSARSRNVWKFL